jgi:hypothetical protein
MCVRERNAPLSLWNDSPVIVEKIRKSTFRMEKVWCTPRQFPRTACLLIGVATRGLLIVNIERLAALTG